MPPELPPLSDAPVEESGSSVVEAHDAGPLPGSGARRDGWRRALHEPRHALAVARALLKGRWYRIWFPLRGHRFRAGRNLRVFGRIDLRGPGEVVFGDDVVVRGRTTPWTHAPEARIVVGDNVILGATRFGCMREITIGRDCIVAEASIMDTDFHSTHVDRRSDDQRVRVAPVRIGDNVWIGMGVGILAGTVIGRNSVVSFGTVCMREYPENVILMGNPAKVAAPVPGASSPPAAGR